MQEEMLQVHCLNLTYASVKSGADMNTKHCSVGMQEEMLQVICLTLSHRARPVQQEDYPAWRTLAAAARMLHNLSHHGLQAGGPEIVAGTAQGV